MRRLVVLFALAALSQICFGQNFAGLPVIFSDNMVLQQNTNVPFWGKAQMDGELKISADWGETVKVTIKKDNNWFVKLRTPKAGGPYNVKLQAGDSILVYKNVLVGEVWVCSGQSNMEMPVEGWPPKDTINNSYSVIKNSQNQQIHLFTVVKAVADNKQSGCGGTWVECNPENAAKFSATAYFFGKKLNDELKIPIGLIHTSWGGTPIEAWISSDYLKDIPDYKSIIDKISMSSKETKKMTDWLETFPVMDMNNKTGADKWQGILSGDAGCEQAGYNDSLWHVMKLPTNWESTEVGDLDGLVWFRKKIEIPQTWANKDLVLELGPVDDMDETYVNGTKIGQMMKDGLWQVDRVYDIPKELVKDNTLTIAVRVLDTQGGGGIYGQESKLSVHPKGSDEKISLAGDWKYLPVAVYKGGKFYVIGAKGEKYYSHPKMVIELTAYTPTALYNAMINPLIPYGIKGAIWYQGESNAGQPERYTDLMKRMITNWRKEWMEGEFPFYYVQIAPFDYGEKTQSQKLREAQLKALSIPNTGMAVTMDIGSPITIHPGNKKEVGARLALWALAKNYDKDVNYSGPLFKEMKISGKNISLCFTHTEKGLLLQPIKGNNNFLIAGKDKVFKPANVKIKGDMLIVSNDEIAEPVAVRYCWGNIKEATLFNRAGLPASSFRTDDWQE